jgi:transcription termination/antitermination protein NusG
MSEETQEPVKEGKMEQENAEAQPEEIKAEEKVEEAAPAEEEKPEEPAEEAPEEQEEKPAEEEKAEEPAEEEKPEDKPEEADKKEEDKESAPAEPKKKESIIFALRTTANREDQVMDFVTSNITRKGLDVYSVIRAHGMRGYIFLEAGSRVDAEQAAYGIPYARGILPKEIDYSEMEHMIEPMKRELNIRKSDIVEIISGPFKRETAKITRIDEQKEEVVVELVEAAVPIPITLKIDAVKVIRRDSEEVKL